MHWALSGTCRSLGATASDVTSELFRRYGFEGSKTTFRMGQILGQPGGGGGGGGGSQLSTLQAKSELLLGTYLYRLVILVAGAGLTIKAVNAVIKGDVGDCCGIDHCVG